MESPPKAAKLSPVEFSCAGVRALSFKGHLTTITADGDRLMADFVAAYRREISAAVDFLVRLTNGSSWDDKLAVYLLVNPTHVPTDVAATALWREVVLSDDGGVAGLNWGKLHGGSNIAYMIRAYVTSEGRKSAGGKAFAAVLAHYGVKPPSLTAENLDRYFGFFQAETVALPFRAALGGAAKSFLSNRELARLQNEERKQTVARLLAEYPAFFNPFMRLHLTESAFATAARYFTELRRSLREEQVPGEVIAACQWKAVLNQARLAPWHPAEPLDPEFLAIAERNPNVLARFEALLPDGVPAAPLPSDRFKRISSTKARPRDLGRNIHIMSRVLALHQAAFNSLPPERLAAIDGRDADRAHTKEHQGWLKIVAATKKSDPALFAIRTFVLGPVREFCNAMWPVIVPEAPEATGLSPVLANNLRYGWAESDETPASAPANSMAVSILVPSYRKADGTMTTDVRVEALVRGNIPGQRARKLDTPLNVLNGATQFLPDRTIAMPGTSGQRRLFVKLQAMRLYEAGARLFGIFSASVMPEMPESSRAAAQERAAARRAAKMRKKVIKPGRFRELSDGERVATVHVAPGGLRVATVAIFQRVTPSKNCPTGFEQIEFTQQVYRSDADAFDGEGKRRRIKFNQATKAERIVSFEADSLDRQFEERAKPAPAGAGLPTANEVHMAQFGAFRTNAGKVFYRKIAREIADICARNQVGHVVVGGAGIIYGKSRVQHPARDFYTLMKVGGKQQPVGYLPNAMGKIGASLYAVSAKGANFDVHAARRGLDGELSPVNAFNVVREIDDDEVRTVAYAKGKKVRIIRSDWISKGEDWLQASRCYPTNAAWAILLIWHDAAFKAKVEESIETYEQKPLLLPALTRLRVSAGV